MHGKNITRGLAKPGELLQVAEVFYTIQGEGPLSGMPAVFIRLSGCNLHCHFCDTVWDDEKDPYMTAKQLVNQVDVAWKTATGYRPGNTLNSPQPTLVVLTGGEPGRQDCAELVALLNYEGYQVQIETAGTYWADWMRGTRIVVSPKLKFVHPTFGSQCFDWKYVIRAGEIHNIDGLPGLFTQEESPDLEGDQEHFRILQNKFGAPCRPPKGATVWLSPCDEGPGEAEKSRLNLEAVRDLALKYGYRAQVQLHKILELR